MNEQIRELAQQAGMYVDLNGNSWPKSMSAEECEAAYKKFAELIVLECMYVGRLAQINNQLVDSEIKDHFGVEE